MLVKSGGMQRKRSMRNVGLAIVTLMGATALVCLSGLTLASQDQPAPVPPAVPPAASPAVPPAPDPLSKLAFLTGTWRGTVGQDHVEEIWSAPSGDSIVGTFRWVSAGKTTLYELLSIKAEGEDAVLRLRHFNAKFEPWKGECDGVAALKAIAIEPTKVIFENATQAGGIAGVDYRTENNTLFITVRFADANHPALEFELQKAQ
jgi:hypothetical protein